MILLFVICAVCVGIAYTYATFFYMYRDRNLHFWPSITRCRICEKRIWAWQRYERRALRVKLDTPDVLLAPLVGIGAYSSALFHKGCKGDVEAKISVTYRGKQ
jgi:hypothetical protein